ncbi:UNVERIFIED_CONTAM: E3 ubiquitin-protein ligase [Sesamum latifolium]|uniref:RING-type E3 ubiquitin transferase n=1 Tax=Sesamum latifolium TaxID=2727402 RepID=A0AAW2Y7V7_9LAMI
MGAACCCLRDDWEEFANPNSSIYRNCICLHCFIQNFVHVYASLFHRGEERALPSSTQGTASLSSTASLDNSLADMYRSPPRPLPYDADPRYFRLQRDGLVSRREKGSSHSHEETEPLRTAEAEEESESVSSKNKWNKFTCEEESKEFNSRSSLKLSTAKPTTGFAHIYTSSEDEDVCPTCLEGHANIGKRASCVLTFESGTPHGAKNFLLLLTESTDDATNWPIDCDMNVISSSFSHL